jgi:hypothetical protein
MKREQRATMGRLRDSKIKASTLVKYKAGAQGFHTFCLQGLGRLAESWDEMDQQMCDYLEHLWEQGESKGSASDAICGTQHFLRVKRKLPAAIDLLGEWRAREPPDRAPPMSEAVMWALVALACQDGFPGAAVCILLGFHCMLRTMEMLTLKWEHIQVDASFKGVVTLPWTKVGQRRGAQEMVTILAEVIGRIIASFKPTPGVGSVCEMTPHKFRAWYAQALMRLGLQSLDLRVYSLRRGGATAHFAAGQDIASTLFRGRWSGMKVGRVYITEGLAILGGMTLNASTRSRLERCKLAFFEWID